LAWLAAIGLVLGLAPLRESSPAQARDGSGSSVWNGDIYVVNADGSARTRLTRDPAEEIDPAWSPDGMKIAFSRFTEGRYQIFVMNADGTNAAQLTHGTPEPQTQRGHRTEAALPTPGAKGSCGRPCHDCRRQWREKADVRRVPVTRARLGPHGQRIAFARSHGPVQAMER
jgi:dipeptidyl aminopeptidase/acylaminoacyl peptidase